MWIREFDYSIADYEAVVRVINTVWSEHIESVDDLKMSDEQYTTPYVRQRFLAIVDDIAVGHGVFEHDRGTYHPQRFWIHLDVLPEYRQHAIGRRLYHHMLTILRTEYDAIELYTSILNTDDHSIRFVEQCGFKEEKRDWESRLTVRDFDATPFQGLEEELKAQHIAITSLNDLLSVDEGALYKVYDLHQTIMQDIVSPTQHTRVAFESWREGNSAENPNYLPQAHFIAHHDSHYIGLTSLRGDPSSGRLYTGLTGVRRDYRRRGIATALKLRSISFAQNYDDPIVITYNMSDNPMLALNLKLGFVKHHSKIWFRLNL